MAGFDLGAYLGLQVDNPSADGGVPADVIRIGIGKLAPTALNKKIYRAGDIEELKSSIEQVGLLHNLVVEKLLTEQGEWRGYYRVLSGHRRHQALCELHRADCEQRSVEPYREGYEADKYGSVLCLVADAKDELENRLRLLTANATARVLTAPEQARQAEELRRVLEEMRAAGYAIKGKLRELVAAQMQVSPAKVGRMERIQTRLCAEARAAFDAGRITEGVAYDLCAVENWNEQGRIVQAIAAKKPVYESDFSQVGRRILSACCVPFVRREAPPCDALVTGEPRAQQTACGGVAIQPNAHDRAAATASADEDEDEEPEQALVYDGRAWTLTVSGKSRPEVLRTALEHCGIALTVEIDGQRVVASSGQIGKQILTKLGLTALEPWEAADVQGG
jgi:ParB-like chromosome segregation protein Spo0J